MSSATLDACFLRNTDLARTNLQGASLRDTVLTNASFAFADPRGVQITPRELLDADLPSLASARLDPHIVQFLGL